MTIEIIPDQTYLADAKQTINQNFGEISSRLMNLEDNLGQIRYGTTAPDENTGNTGDFYIRQGEPNLFYGPKAIDGSWPEGQEIRGDRGTIHKGTWNSGLGYVKNDAVYYRGSYWFAKTASIGVEPTTDNTVSWGILSQGLNWVGPWNENAQVLREGDVVTHLGNAFRVLTNHNTNNTVVPERAQDNARYARLSIKGEKGDTGDAGKTILNGTTDPAAGTGVDGDFYLRTDTMRMFGPKTAGAWGTGTLLKGDPGTNGQGVPTGGTTGQHLRKTSSTNYATEWSNEGLTIGASIYKSATQTIDASLTTDTLITFDSILWERVIPGGAAQTVAQIGSNRLRAPLAGVYIVHGELAITGIATAGRMVTTIQLNGITNVDVESWQIAAANTQHTQHVYKTIELAAGDTLKLLTDIANSTDDNVLASGTTGTTFEMWRIGD